MSEMHIEADQHRKENLPLRLEDEGFVQRRKPCPAHPLRIQIDKPYEEIQLEDVQKALESCGHSLTISRRVGRNRLYADMWKARLGDASVILKVYGGVIRQQARDLPISIDPLCGLQQEHDVLSSDSSRLGHYFGCITDCNGRPVATIKEWISGLELPHALSAGALSVQDARRELLYILSDARSCGLRLVDTAYNNFVFRDSKLFLIDPGSLAPLEDPSPGARELTISVQEELSALVEHILQGALEESATTRAA